MSRFYFANSYCEYKIYFLRHFLLQKVKHPRNSLHHEKTIIDTIEQIEYTNEIQSIDVLYAVNAKKEPAGSLSPEVSTPPTGPTISIFNLLDCVNNCFLVM